MSLLNPKREFEISKPDTEIKKALTQASQFFPDDYKLEREDNLINQYRLHKKGILLDAGYDIDVTLIPAFENRTRTTIEVSRRFGVIDTNSEVQIASTILSDFTTRLSSILQGKVEEEVKIEKVKTKAMNVTYLMIVLGAVVAITGYYFKIKSR